MSTYDFWDSLLKNAYTGVAGVSDTVNMFLDDAVDTTIQPKAFDSVRERTDKFRNENALELPVKAGTRVSFEGNLGAVLSYADVPENGATGTVVSVKSATGDITSHEGKVFIEWDDKKFRPIHVEHLRAASEKKTQVRTSTMRVSSLGDLSDFLKISSEALVHKATKDIWSFRKEGESFVIERLLDDEGNPLKV